MDANNQPSTIGLNGGQSKSSLQNNKAARAHLRTFLGHYGIPNDVSIESILSSLTDDVQTTPQDFI